MKSAHELLRENFDRWELRGRGVLTFPDPVSPKPPFAPFPGHYAPQFTRGMDSVRPTGISSFFQRAKELIRGENGTALQDATASHQLPEESEIEPDWCGKKMDWIELGMRVPQTLSPSRESLAAVLAGLPITGRPLCFEIVGTGKSSFCQWAASTSDARALERQMQAQFPEVKLTRSQNRLRHLWEDCEGRELAVVDFALSEPFMWPLAESKQDAFVSLVGSLLDLADDELGLYQVIFEQIDEPWEPASLDAVSKSDGKPFFNDGADLQRATRDKMRSPLYGVVLRMASRASEVWRAWEILREMAPALRILTNPSGNSLFPLTNDDLDDSQRESDVLHRQSHHCGMLLNQLELLSLVHLPSSALQSPRFERTTSQTRSAAQNAATAQSVCIGINEHDGEQHHVQLNREQRLRHTHIIGGTGTGKSTLLFSMIQQDIENGGGIAVLDPHGDLIDRVLGIIPQERLQDVILLDPSDEEYVTPFNILSAHSDFERTLLASDLVSVFQRLSTSFGDQMQIVMQNAVLAFLESSRGGTLADMRRFLLDTSWREQFLETVKDADVRFYWQKAFPQLGGGRSIGPVITRLETFLSSKPVRLMVSQPENRIDFYEMMNGGKIFLVKLSQGWIGRENAFLLGSLVMTKLQQAAMSRARMPADQRRAFYCYIDEFHHFITPSLSEILSGARKYGLGLVLAHQELRQLERDKDVASALLSNAHTRLVFRVGDADARALSEGFAHFEFRDLQNLAIGHAIARIGQADHDFNLKVLLPTEEVEAYAEERRAAAINASRTAHALPRHLVEAEMLRRLNELSESSPRSKAAKKTEPAPVAKIEPKAASSEPTIDPILTDIEGETSSPSIAVEAQNFSPQPIQKTRISGMGRGGQDHQILVERVCQEGARLGYLSVKEAGVSSGRVDVVLQRGSLKVAVEVAVFSNTRHELDNLRKGLAEDFTFVISLSPLPAVLDNIRAAAEESFSTEEIQRLRFFAPDELAAWLHEQASQFKETKPAERRIGGRRVKIKHAELSVEERRRIEEESLSAIADAIRRRSSNME